MDAPWMISGVVTPEQGLVLFLLAGIAFGAVLQGAGLGSARTVLGQFFLTDLRLLRVLFTALVTALVGAWILAGLGVLAWDAVVRPVTAVGPQILGGAVFGVGLVVGGYCPGTALVGVVQGRWDALGVVVGLVLGVVIMGLLSPVVDPWLAEQGQGVVLLPSVLHAPTGVVVLGVVILGLAALALAEVWERRQGAVSDLLAGRRMTFGRWWWGLLLLGAVVTVAWPEPTTQARRLVTASEVAATLAQPPTVWSPVQVAEALRQDPAGWRVVDLRPNPEERWPGAVTVSLAEVATQAWPVAGRWVVVATQEDEARLAAQVLRLRGLAAGVLAGGWDAWQREVVHPVVMINDSEGSHAEVQRRRALARHFGGEVLLVRAAASPATSPWGVPGSTGPPPAPGSTAESEPGTSPSAPPASAPAGGVPAPTRPSLPPHLLGGCR